MTLEEGTHEGRGGLNLADGYCVDPDGGASQAGLTKTKALADAPPVSGHAEPAPQEMQQQEGNGEVSQGDVGDP
jgi:hypothetical protein